jgi:ankyrin repeat protein
MKSVTGSQIHISGLEGTIMELSKLFRLILIAIGMVFLCSTSLCADHPDAGINHPSGDKAISGSASGFIEKGNKVSITPDQFLDAVRNGSLAVVKAALSQGMNINSQNEAGESALHLVGDIALAEYLIARGADVNLPDKEFGMTPIFFQEVPITRLLVATGADVNARSHQGNTPVIWFAYSNYLEGIRYLVSAGADIHAVNQDGKTVWDVASHFGSPELIEYLRSIGAQKKFK